MAADDRTGCATVRRHSPDKAQHFNLLSASPAVVRPLHHTPNRLLGILLLLLAGTSLAVAASGSGQAVVTPFDQTPLKDAVRSVLVTRRGRLVAGSNTLAVFDGQGWQSVPTPEGYGFRALAEHPTNDGHIFVGGIGALGTIRQQEGSWRFERVGSGMLNAGDIWSVHPFADGALWVGTGALYRAHNAEVDVLPLSTREKPTSFTAPQGVIVHQPGTGLLRVSSTASPVLLVPETDLPSRPLNWALTHPDGTTWLGLGEEAYLWEVSASGGASPAIFRRLDALSRALKGTAPTSATLLENGRVAIGTFRAGVVLADAAGNPQGNLTAADGLGSGSIFSLTAHDHQLWLAQAHGVMRIDAPGQARFFERRRDLADDTPRRVISTGKQTLLLGTNGAALIHGDSVVRLAGAPEVSWDATATADSFWIGGFGGIWKTDGTKLDQVHHVSTDVLCLAPSRQFPGALVFTEGYDLKLLIASPHGGWAARDLGFRALDTPVSVLEDTRQNVWLATMKGGIYRFRWTESRGGQPPVLAFVQHYRAGVGLPRAMTRPQLVEIGGTVLALAEEGIFRADSARFSPAEELKEFLGVSVSPRALENGGTGAYVLLQHRSLAAHGAYGVATLNVGSDGTLHPELLEVPGIDLGAWTHLHADSTALWLSGPKGVLRVAREAVRPAPAPPAVRLATVPQPHQPTESTAAETEPRSASFVFPTTTAITGRAAFYQTRLDHKNADTPWSAPTAEARREFSQLAPGRYTFEVRALDRFGRAGPLAAHAFSIPVPWWRTPFALTGYGATLLLLVLAGARLRIRTLERQNERLNRLVAERTRELEMSNTAKSEFLENISHEIRNPLNGLTGLMALMKEERLAPAERAHVKSLKAVATTLANVFEDVLQFSKIEYGYVRLNPRPFRLRELLEELVALFAMNRELHGCSVDLEWPSATAAEQNSQPAPELADGFVGDPDRIRTVIANFLSNSVKYAPNSPVIVRVMATEESAGHVDLYIDVIDRGPGIPPEEQELIFKKFVRGSRAKEQQIPGTGLGLATCNVLARLMNGQVSVESTPGKGSTFSLRLLLPRAPQETITPTPATLTSQRNGRPRALVLDDEPYNRTILEGLALELGYEPALTANPTEALDRLTREPYDIIFLDWELPGMKGGEVAQQIRALPHGRDPIILATTAHDSDEMQQRCRDSGMDGFLLKPFDARRVRAAIDTVREWRGSHPNGNANLSGAPFWSEQPLKNSHGLDLSAFDQYARARPDDPHGGRVNYLATLATQRQALEQAAATHETNQLANTAHRLRALAGLIRAKQLNEAATELEFAARNGNVSTNSPQLNAVLAACDELRRRLEETS